MNNPKIDAIAQRDEQLEDIASDLFSALCEGDGTHSEELARALILAHLRRVAALRAMFDAGERRLPLSRARRPQETTRLLVGRWSTTRGRC